MVLIGLFLTYNEISARTSFRAQFASTHKKKNTTQMIFDDFPFVDQMKLHYNTHLNTRKTINILLLSETKSSFTDQN